MSPNLWTQTTTDACKPWFLMHFIGQCRFPDAHMPCLICACLGWFCAWLANFTFPPLLIVPPIDRCRCCQDDAHTPWVMCAWIGWYCMSLSDVTCQIHPNHVRSVMTLIYVAYHFPTSPSRCMQSMTDVAVSMCTFHDLVCMIWMMLPAFGWCCVEDAHKTRPLLPSLMRTHPGWCMQHLPVGAWHWVIFLGQWE